MFYHFFITRHLFFTKEKQKFVCTIEQGAAERVVKDLIAGVRKTSQNGRRMADGERRTVDGGNNKSIKINKSINQ